MTRDKRSVRQENMAQRRARIVAAARDLITHGGLDGLNLRALAAAADVTVPTIYNLIGNKEAVVVALFSDVLSEIESRIQAHADDAPLARITAVVTESTGVFAEDEAYYRAAFIAVEYLDQNDASHAAVDRLYRWAELIIFDGLQACREAGLLQKKIPVALLAEQVLRSYRTSCRAWAFGQIPIEYFRATALIDLYTTLAADAVVTFHTSLIKQISKLANARERIAMESPIDAAQAASGME